MFEMRPSFIFRSINSRFISEANCLYLMFLHENLDSCIKEHQSPQYVSDIKLIANLLAAVDISLSLGPIQVAIEQTEKLFDASKQVVA